MTARSLEGLADCDPRYRPTNFWGPGLEQLLADMRGHGLSRFKSWPTAGFWFYPVYGNGFSYARIDALLPRAQEINPRVTAQWLRKSLTGGVEAGRDFDAARLGWDQNRWPFDLEGFGESTVGEPPQRYSVSPAPDVRHGRPYLNYLLCLAALSRHVTEPPRSFLELGGGYGVLGEIVMSRDPEARYVNLDIPPLLTVGTYYLTELFGRDRVLGPDDVAETGELHVPKSGCLPNWRLPDLTGRYDVFVNSYSFQEMEPDVVEHYVDRICEIGPGYVVSLNSTKGKPKKSDGHEIGVVEPVTSARIITMFEARGYVLLSTYQRPLIISAGEIAVLRRK
ncbi:hypothetical protein BA895_15275 [Humibacillus sp. DSM 29435]|uniref:putative sugar O-methyltransferase n=1 Tax=Humibacillus sp. DSM 29435 TaxID=1869167 RepID=UPI00087323A9|nr:putative sugar O-methyltransferase [Humibacillus sp. DSM 29435]OFE17606.1 hypothetical protein BA895_15275 [Humibacillus sp. DSM 29435]